MAAHPYKLQDAILSTPQQPSLHQHGWLGEWEMSPPAVIIPGLYKEVHSPVANPLRAPEVLANRSLALAHCNLHKINKKRQVETVMETRLCLLT